MILKIEDAANILKSGGVIAYPTEAVFGLGCDPLNEKAINRILKLKKRPGDKGFIIIASHFRQLENYVESVPEQTMQEVLKTWPGPVTWIFPAKKTVSKLLVGADQTIAVRVTAHLVAKQLCEMFGGAIVSTSANISNESPARDIATLQRYFDNQLDGIVEGELGSLTKPTEIRDVITNKVIRRGD